jgi:hypothetical protein
MPESDFSRPFISGYGFSCDWKIHADFAQHLIHIARDTHIDDTLPGC